MEGVVLDGDADSGGRFLIIGVEEDGLVFFDDDALWGEFANADAGSLEVLENGDGFAEFL